MTALLLTLALTAATLAIECVPLERIKMQEIDRRVLDALREAPSGAYKLTKRTRLSSRAVRESLARLEAVDLIRVADVGPRGGKLYAANDTPHP